jgi:transcriptional regulator with XRE-family HTH domain
MPTWEDLKKEITVISDSEKLALEITAITVAKLIERRKMLGWTQEDLAQKSGLKQAAIGRLESGRGGIPRIETLLIVATAMGMKLGIYLEEQAAALAYA